MVACCKTNADVTPNVVMEVSSAGDTLCSGDDGVPVEEEEDHLRGDPGHSQGECCHQLVLRRLTQF